ncbi:MAG: hypothetical protein CEE42_02090 [Promethearchaeota archaeon Loki_b31]|nr:MAG: hypothetical protein CEE42_02090 [Candidatus Lokiarchaeota archaeon Loki_b31]
MKEDTAVVKIKFYDHGLGREQVIYGEVKASKIDRFETNEDSWITLTDSNRSLIVPKIDVACISEFKELGELDGHEKELNIAFEFNGPQHYKLSHWMEVYGLSESVARKRFYIQIINDLNKLRECQKKDTVLIVLSSLDNPSDWQDIIVHQYELWTGKKAPVKHPLDYESVLKLISEEDIGTLKIKFLKNFSG